MSGANTTGAEEPRAGADPTAPAPAAPSPAPPPAVARFEAPTADAMGTPFVPFGYDSADGIRLAGRIYGRFDATGARDRALGIPAPLVCLPGLTRNVRDFEPVAAHVAATGRTVVAFDLRGRGRSASADPATYTPAQEAGDVIRGVTALGLARVALLGTSRGGLVGMLIPAFAPGLLAGLVLNDIGPEIELAGLLRLRDELTGRAATDDAATPLPLDWERATALVAHRFRPIYPRLDAPGFARLARRLMQDVGGRPAPDFDPAIAAGLAALTPETRLPDLWAPFDALRDMPVLAIRGALSDLLSERVVTMMAARHPDFSTLTVADEGHAPLLEDAPALGAIAAFLDRADAASAAR